jgi:hypothetical protein
MLFEGNEEIQQDEEIYPRPGFRKLKFGSNSLPKFEIGETQAGVPYLQLNLSNEHNFSFWEKMYVSEKAKSRVVYLWKALFNEQIPKINDIDELLSKLNEKYSKTFRPNHYHNFLVSGVWKEDKLFCKLSFDGFLNPPNFQERAFTERETKYYIK